MHYKLTLTIRKKYFFLNSKPILSQGQASIVSYCINYLSKFLFQCDINLFKLGLYVCQLVSRLVGLLFVFVSCSFNSISVMYAASFQVILVLDSPPNYRSIYWCSNLAREVTWLEIFNLRSITSILARL